MFDDEARAAIKRLDLATARDANVSAESIAAMKPVSTLQSLSQENIDHYHASKDFQSLLNVLSMVVLATMQDMEPKKSIYRVDEPLRAIASGAFGVYLAVPIKESPSKDVMKYLVSAAPFPTTDGWPGNPIGNLTRGWESLHYLFLGKSYADNRLYTDSFYTSLSAAVPILNQDGSTLAILGLDYAATEERNQLTVLRYFCYFLVAASLLLSVVSSYYVARKLSSSLRLLADAAQKVADNDYSVVLDIKSNDEFAVLGSVFNQMTANIKKILSELEEKNNQFITLVVDMHDGVGAILTSITLNSAMHVDKEKAPCCKAREKLASVNHLAREGLAEVRFLMNVLDYGHYDFQAIIEEVQMQSAYILAPSGIQFDLKITGNLPEAPFHFKQFIELQRIFREVFVNIVKHSDATCCVVAIECSGAGVTVSISDDGSNGQKTTASGGRGLKSLAGRAKQLGGSLEYSWRNGFYVKLNLPQSFQSLAPKQAVGREVINKSLV